MHELSFPAASCSQSRCDNACHVLQKDWRKLRTCPSPTTSQSTPRSSPVSRTCTQILYKESRDAGFLCASHFFCQDSQLVSSLKLSATQDTDLWLGISILCFGKAFTLYCNDSWIFERQVQADTALDPHRLTRCLNFHSAKSSENTGESGGCGVFQAEMAGFLEVSRHKNPKTRCVVCKGAFSSAPC